jgi:DNA helicase-2/ATP-dependent DNA helicase PcrA
LLIDNDPTNDWEVVGAQFDFVEPISEGEYHKEKVVITPDDVATVTEQVKSVYQKIQNHDFNTGCGKKECDWCHFVRSNFKQADTIMELSGEEEDDH